MTELEPAPAAPRVRRPLWRRLLRWTLFGLLGLFVLLVAAVLFLHTGPGQDLVRGLVEDALAERVDGEVELERLEFSLFGGPLRLTGLTIRNADGHDAIVLDALTVDLALSSLLSERIVVRSLELDGLHVTARERADGTLDLATLFVPEDEPREPLDKLVALEALHVADLDFALHKADGTRIAIDDLAIEGHLEAAPAAEGLDLTLGALSLGLTLEKPDGTRVSVPKLTTSVTVARKGKDLSAALGEIAARATIVLPVPPPPDAPEGTAPTLRTLDVALGIGAVKVGLANGRVDALVEALDLGAARIERLALATSLPEPGQPLALLGDQRAALEGVRIDAAELNALLGQRVLVSNVALDLSLSGPPDALVLAGKVDTDGGALALAGTANAADLKAPSYHLELHGTDIATDKLLALDIPEITSSLDLTIDGSGATRELAIVDFVLAIGPTRIDDIPVDGIDLRAHLEKGRFSIEALVVRAFGQELRIVGALEADQAFSARFDTAADLDKAVGALRAATLLPDDFRLPVELGRADFDLSIGGTPRTADTPAIISALLPPELAAKLPLATASLAGRIDLDDVRTDSMSAGSVDTEIDLRLDESGPFGTIAIAVEALDTEALDLEHLDARLELKDDVLSIELVGLDGKAVVVDVLAHASVDAARDELVLDLRRARVARGRLRTELLEPAELRLPRTIGATPVEVVIPRIALSLAGGRVSVAGRANVHRDPPPEDSPEGTQGPLAVDDFDLAIALDSIDLRQAAALAGRKVPLEGALRGTVILRGTPAEPDAELALDASIRARDKDGRRAARAIDLTVRGTARRGRARLDLSARDLEDRSQSPLVAVHLDAPLRTDGTPGLASSGKLDLVVTIPRRRIAELLPYVPASLVPAGIDPDGTVELALDLDGSPGRPTGTLALDLEGQWLSFVDPAAWAGRTQRLTVAGRIDAPAGSGPATDLELQLWLDREQERTVTAHATAQLRRSPLTARKLELETWTLDLALAPLDLARIPAPDPARPLPRGQLAATVALHGTDRDLLGEVGLSARELRLPGRDTLPPIDLDLGLALADHLALDTRVRLGGEERLTLGGRVGIDGHGLVPRLRDRAALLESSLELVLRIPDHALAEWASVAPGLAELPGTLGGEVRVFDRLSHPQLEGAVTWDEFTALDGKPGAVHVALGLDDRTLQAGLRLGDLDAERAALALGVELGRAELEAFVRRESARLPITLEGRSREATLRRLTPDFAIDGDAIDVDGRIELELDGDLVLVRHDDGALAPEEVDFTALLALRDGALAVPGSERRFHDLALVVRADPNRITLERIEARETDLQTDERHVLVSGRVDLEDLKPTLAELTIEVDRWLAVGAFDSPQAAITADLDVAADLREPGKQVEVVVHDLFFDSTTRYPRGHFFRDLGQHDIVWMDAPGAPPVGKLAVGHGTEPAQPAAAAPAAEPDPDAPTHTVTVIIEKARAISDVLVLEPQGRVVANIGPGGVALDGHIEILGGSLEFVSEVFPLTHGSVTLGGEHGPVWLDLNFAREPGNESKRAIAGDDERTTVQVLGDPVGNDLIIRGAGGPVLETAMSTHIGQTPLVYSAPDSPASNTVATPEGEMPLIQSFMGTNLPHMLFLDHAVAWADPYTWAGGYGELRHARYDMMLHDGTGRLRVAAEPPKTAGSEAELQYDWIWGDSGQAIYGMGARLGDRVAAGVEIFVEWSSVD